MTHSSLAMRMIVLSLVIVTFLELTEHSQGQTQAPLASSSAKATDDHRVAGPASVEIPAVNYYSRSGKSTTEFSPTALMPSASGRAEVKMAKEGSVSINAQFVGLESATRFGNEFLIYVLWASVPKGRTLKIGEITYKGTQGELEATTALHTFAMFVTAEPYAAVTKPSNVVVLRGGSSGSDTTPTVSSQVELLSDAYAPPGYVYEPLDISSGYPSGLLQAMNARRIATLFRADSYAPQQFRNAESLYQYLMASAIQEKKPSRKLLQVAKVVAEDYEEARAVSIRQQKNRQKQ